MNNIKISLTAHYAKLGLAKKMVHNLTCVSHNSYHVANINICKYRLN
jgi:hypothetical protein